ncbi:MAG: selenoneine biosynthesis selenosugar synthase SenB [Planctomycetaceae bacterium]
MSHIVIVTPAPPGSRKGNRITASRWAGLLRSIGHQVQVRQKVTRSRCDVLIALHARKSADQVQVVRQVSPGCPVVIVLTGTDLYGDIHSSRAARQALDTADRLVVLQPDGVNELPASLHSKTRVIFQSAVPLRNPPPPLKSVFEICVCGHLRPVKDPFRAAIAARRLPVTSRIRITHAGAALTAAMERRAIAETVRNSRYRWPGEVTHHRARSLIARSRLLVVSSRLEGGANVISEAITSGVPVLSTRISGSTGLLGQDYAGFFEFGNARELAGLMLRCEREVTFLEELTEQCQQRALQLTPENERTALRLLVAELTP